MHWHGNEVGLVANVLNTWVVGSVDITIERGSHFLTMVLIVDRTRKKAKDKDNCIDLYDALETIKQKFLMVTL